MVINPTRHTNPSQIDPEIDWEKRSRRGLELALQMPRWCKPKLPDSKTLSRQDTCRALLFSARDARSRARGGGKMVSTRRSSANAAGKESQPMVRSARDPDAFRGAPPGATLSWSARAGGTPVAPGWSRSETARGVRERRTRRARGVLSLPDALRAISGTLRLSWVRPHTGSDTSPAPTGVAQRAFFDLYPPGSLFPFHHPDFSRPTPNPHRRLWMWRRWSSPCPRTVPERARRTCTLG